uniref:Uncharacterized protein n=1 Tax=Arundo donax TaxID=35708 RepID=A0A0A9BP30_ARUDO
MITPYKYKNQETNIFRETVKKLYLHK